MAKMISLFDTTSAADNRYYEPDVAHWVSPNGLTRAMLLVELKHIEELHSRGLCPESALREIRRACRRVMAEEVAEEEERLRHDIRALVACIKKYTSDEAGKYVHHALTSMDVKITAEMYNYKQLFNRIVIPELVQLEQILINLTLREADAVQIGRTHLQHAVPITLGFALAEYVNRLGDCIVHLKTNVGELRGKFSGATGSANALLLVLKQKEAVPAYEAGVLARLGLKPPIHSTQLPPAEPRVRLMGEITTTAMVLYNLADDIRLMCSTEIGEVDQKSISSGGSSAMGQKINPQDYEKASSLVREIIGKLVTVHLNQVSNFQRDLKDSAATRTYPETISYFVTIIRTLSKAMSTIQFDHEHMAENLLITKGDVLTEAYKTLLVQVGCSDADAIMRRVAKQAREEQRMLHEVALENTEVAPFLALMDTDDRKVLEHPRNYTGIAAEKTRQTVKYWASKLKLAA